MTPPGTTTPPGTATPSTPAVPVSDRNGNGPRGDLAYTGSDSVMPAIGAGLALLLGASLVVTTAIRRRRLNRS